MARSFSDAPKRTGRGRPSTGGRDPMVGARFPPELAARVDAWARKTDVGIRRADATRRLVKNGLKAKGKAR